MRGRTGGGRREHWPETEGETEVRRPAQDNGEWELLTLWQYAHMHDAESANPNHMGLEASFLPRERDHPLRRLTRPARCATIRVSQG